MEAVLRGDPWNECVGLLRMTGSSTDRAVGLKVFGADFANLQVLAIDIEETDEWAKTLDTPRR